MALHRIDFPVLARGMNREAPIGTLNPNAAEGPPEPTERFTGVRR